jgi:hypothetical protein
MHANHIKNFLCILFLNDCLVVTACLAIGVDSLLLLHALLVLCIDFISERQPEGNIFKTLYSSASIPHSSFDFNADSNLRSPRYSITFVSVALSWALYKLVVDWWMCQAFWWHFQELLFCYVRFTLYSSASIPHSSFDFNEVSDLSTLRCSSICICCTSLSLFFKLVGVELLLLSIVYLSICICILSRFEYLSKFAYNLFVQQHLYM